MADVAVVLATRNRSAMLRRTLERIASLETPGFEASIVVADSGSTDDTVTVLNEARLAWGVRYVVVEEPGKNRALNRALELVNGRLVVFTDDDVLPEPQWLTELHAASRRWPDADVFGGRTLLAPPPGTPDWLMECGAHAVNFARYAPMEEEGLTSLAPYGPNFAVRASVLEAFRFAEDVGPDGTDAYAMGSETEFLIRLAEAGHPMVYVPGARLRHVVRPEQLTLEALVARSARGGRGWARQHEMDADVPHLMGAPRWLWRELAQAAIGRATARLSGPERHLPALMHYHRVLGMISEIRGSRE